jgi:hypothetical protein
MTFIDDIHKESIGQVNGTDTRCQLLFCTPERGPRE